MKELRKYIRGQILIESLKFNEMNNLCLFVIGDDRSRAMTFVLAHIDLETTLEIIFEEMEEGNIQISPKTLINYKNLQEIFKDVIAVMGIVKHTNRSLEAWEVKVAAAQDGWGPTMYDIIMGISPNGLIGDRSEVSRDAFGVYEFYYDHRNDIEKKPLDIGGKFTPETNDDADMGAAGTYLSQMHGNLSRKSLSWDEYLEDPLSWAYNRKKVPGTDEMIVRGQQIKSMVGPWLGPDAFDLAIERIHRAFFLMKY